MIWLKAFIAGFLATLLVHQPVLAILHAAGIASRAAYSFDPTRPFGIPTVISLAFWGGVWGLPLLAVLRRTRTSASFWLTALIFGAIAPTLVAISVVAPLKGRPIGGGGISALTVGLLVNAAWGLGTAVFLRLFRARRTTAPRSAL